MKKNKPCFIILLCVLLCSLFLTSCARGADVSATHDLYADKSTFLAHSIGSYDVTQRSRSTWDIRSGSWGWDLTRYRIHHYEWTIAYTNHLGQQQEFTFVNWGGRFESSLIRHAEDVILYQAAQELINTHFNVRPLPSFEIERTTRLNIDDAETRESISNTTTGLSLQNLTVAELSRFANYQINFSAYASPHSLDSFESFLSDAAQHFGKENVSMRINFRDYYQQAAQGLIDSHFDRRTRNLFTVRAHPSTPTRQVTRGGDIADILADMLQANEIVAELGRFPVFRIGLSVRLTLDEVDNRSLRPQFDEFIKNAARYFGEQNISISFSEGATLNYSSAMGGAVWRVDGLTDAHAFTEDGQLTQVRRIQPIRNGEPMWAISDVMGIHWDNSLETFVIGVDNVSIILSRRNLGNLMGGRPRLPFTGTPVVEWTIDGTSYTLKLSPPRNASDHDILSWAERDTLIIDDGVSTIEICLGTNPLTVTKFAEITGTTAWIDENARTLYVQW